MVGAERKLTLFGITDGNVEDSDNRRFLPAILPTWDWFLLLLLLLPVVADPDWPFGVAAIAIVRKRKLPITQCPVHFEMNAVRLLDVLKVCD